MGRRRHTPTIAAYDAFLKGRHTAFGSLTPESIALSQKFYTRAIELDPEFAEPHAYLAGSIYTMGFLGLRPMREVVTTARSEVRAALALDPDLPDAHAGMATIAALHDYDWEEAEREYRLATAGDSISAEVRHLCTLGYLLSVRPEEGLGHMERAVSDDPLNIGYRHIKAMCLISLGRNDEAIIEERICLELNPHRHPSWVGLAIAYEAQGRFSDARQAAEKAHALAPFDGIPTGHLAGLLMRAGEFACQGLVTADPATPASIRFAGLLHDRRRYPAGRRIRQARDPGTLGRHCQSPAETVGGRNPAELSLARACGSVESESDLPLGRIRVLSPHEMTKPDCFR